MLLVILKIMGIHLTRFMVICMVLSGAIVKGAGKAETEHPQQIIDLYDKHIREYNSAKLYCAKVGKKKQ